MLKKELLDRMEILYPNETRFSDLRRAYLDKDMASLFRLFIEYNGKDVNELRKMVMENNLHVLFRFIDGDIDFNFEHDNSTLLEPGDLRKFILEDNTWSLYRLLLDINDTQIVRAIKSMHAAGIRWDKDAMSRGQLKSKMWLIDELKTLDLELGTVFLCAGWYGILSTLMFENDLNIEKIRSFDIDPKVLDVAGKFNLPWMKDEWKFKAATYDIHDMNYDSFTYDVLRNDGSVCELCDSPDTVINTSCEHIVDFDVWYDNIPDGKTMILQSNDFVEVDEHVNIAKDLNHFAEQTPMSEVLYSDGLLIDTYTRFMRIGIK